MLSAEQIAILKTNLLDTCKRDLWAPASVDLVAELCDQSLAPFQEEKRTFILLATEQGLTPVGKIVDALQAFVTAEDDWRHEKAGIGEDKFDDPLADAYAKAKAALEQFSMYADNIAVAPECLPQRSDA